MHVNTKPARKAAHPRIVFEEKTPIGRTYRVTVDDAEWLVRFYRTFDCFPGKWHLEGTVRHDPADWLYALNQHMAHGGEGLEYLESSNATKDGAAAYVVRALLDGLATEGIYPVLRRS